MTDSRNNAQDLILTACLSEDLLQQIVNAAGQTLRNASFFDLGSHLGPKKLQLEEQLKLARRCIAFVDCDNFPTQAFEIARHISKNRFVRATIVAVTQSTNPADMLANMRAGCNELLAKPASSEDVDVLLDRFDKSNTEDVERYGRQGNVIAMCGAKGGVGTTTLAVHLAYYLAKVHEKKTILIDAHTSLGHACVYLGVDGEGHSFQELLRNADRVDADLLSGFVVKHSSGLDVLSSTDNWSKYSYGQNEMTKFASVMEVIRSEYEYVVIDCDNTQDDRNADIFEMSGQIYFIATPEVAAIRDLSRRMDRIVGMPGAEEKLQIVMNRSSPTQAIDIKQIEKAIGVQVAINIPNRYEDVTRSVNSGAPVTPDSKSELSGQFTKWADTLTGHARRASPGATGKKLLKVLSHGWLSGK